MWCHDRHSKMAELDQVPKWEAARYCHDMSPPMVSHYCLWDSHLGSLFCWTGHQTRGVYPGFTYQKASPYAIATIEACHVKCLELYLKLRGGYMCSTWVCTVLNYVPSQESGVTKTATHMVGPLFLGNPIMMHQWAEAIFSNYIPSPSHHWAPAVAAPDPWSSRWDRGRAPPQRQPQDLSVRPGSPEKHIFRYGDPKNTIGWLWLIIMIVMTSMSYSWLLRRYQNGLNWWHWLIIWLHWLNKNYWESNVAVLLTISIEFLMFIEIPRPKTRLSRSELIVHTTSRIIPYHPLGNIKI